jgi:predicted transcriptional regulator
MKFWEQHEHAMQKAKLLQAAAVIFSSLNRETFGYRISDAVRLALELEKELEKQLNAFKSKRRSE